jgi:hypothetical protein
MDEFIAPQRRTVSGTPAHEKDELAEQALLNPTGRGKANPWELKTRPIPSLVTR